MMMLSINKTINICLVITGLRPWRCSFIGPIIMLSFTVLTLPFQLWYFLRMDNIVIAIDNLSTILLCLLILLKYGVMWINKRIITELLQEIVDEWNRIVIPNKCKTIAYYCDLFCKMDLYIYIVCSIFYHIQSLSRYFYLNVHNRESFLPSYYPFDYQQSPYFEIIYTMHLIQSVALIATDSLCKTLLIVYISHTVIHVRLLKSYANEYFKSYVYLNNKNNSGNYHNLKIVIVEHVKISTLVKKIDNCYTYVSLLQIGINNIIIAISAFTILTNEELVNKIILMKLITFTMIILSQTVTFCLIGDFLESEGNSIANALYNGVWYNVKPTEIKVITFIIEYSQNPLLLTGGKFFKISISSFLRNLKTSISYLSVLRVIVSKT